MQLCWIIILREYQVSSIKEFFGETIIKYNESKNWENSITQIDELRQLARKRWNVDRAIMRGRINKIIVSFFFNFQTNEHFQRVRTDFSWKVNDVMKSETLFPYINWVDN